MKQRRSDSPNIALAPATAGWRLTSSEAAPQPFASLAEAAAAIPADAVVHLALPCSAVLFERMKLPSISPDELGDMMILQLEKTLPYGPEEITSGFDVIEKSESESTLLTATVNNEQLSALCEPLRDRGVVPAGITVFAMHAAAVCPPEQLVLLVYRELEKIVLAFCQNAKLIHVQPLGVNDAAGLQAELPQTILGAELEGLPTGFQRIILDESCADLKAETDDFFHLPTATVSLETTPPGPSLNLLPAPWRQEKRRTANRAQLRSQLIMAAVGYVILVLGAFGWLFGMNVRVNKIDAELQKVSPDIAAIGARKARWDVLAPAIDPARYMVEVLLQITSSLPSDAIRITIFNHNKDQFMIQGEAPTANAAIEYGEHLKKNPELKSFKLNIAPPTILPDDRAQFRIIGKL